MRKTIAFALVIGLLFTERAAHSLTAPDPATGKAADFFGTAKVYTFHLTIAATDFQKMPPRFGSGFRGRGFGRGGFGFVDPFADGDNEERYAKVPVKLQFEGKDWGTLSVRYKGNSTYMSAPAELKRSLKLDFDDIDKSRTFFGMTKLNLNNNAMDSSQMRETLSYDVFRRAGVPAPRTAYAKVFITVPGKYKSEYAGLFTIVEQVDQAFFKERWGKKVGLLLKPEGVNGMPYLGDDWKTYEKRYVSKIKGAPDDAARFIAFTKFVNSASDAEFAKRIGEYLETDRFLRFLAVEVVMVNTDSPLAMTHNYWLTVNPASKKIVWIPWDMNLSFGGFFSGADDLSIHQPSAAGMFPLAERMLSNKEFRRQYDQIVRETVTNNFSVARINDEIRQITVATREAIAAEKQPSRDAFPPPPDFLDRRGFGRRGFGPGGGGPEIAPFVASRIESVLAQLEGKREGTPARGGFRGRGGFPGFPFPPGRTQ